MAAAAHSPLCLRAHTASTPWGSSLWSRLHQPGGRLSNKGCGSLLGSSRRRPPSPPHHPPHTRRACLSPPHPHPQAPPGGTPSSCVPPTCACWHCFACRPRSHHAPSPSASPRGLQSGIHQSSAAAWGQGQLCPRSAAFAATPTRGPPGSVASSESVPRCLARRGYSLTARHHCWPYSAPLRPHSSPSQEAQLPTPHCCA